MQPPPKVWKPSCYRSCVPQRRVHIHSKRGRRKNMYNKTAADLALLWQSHYLQDITDLLELRLIMTIVSTVKIWSIESVLWKLQVPTRSTMTAIVAAAWVFARPVAIARALAFFVVNSQTRESVRIYHAIFAACHLQKTKVYTSRTASKVLLRSAWCTF